MRKRNGSESWMMDGWKLSVEGLFTPFGAQTGLLWIISDKTSWIILWIVIKIFMFFKSDRVCFSRKGMEDMWVGGWFWL